MKNDKKVSDETVDESEVSSSEQKEEKADCSEFDGSKNRRKNERRKKENEEVVALNHEITEKEEMIVKLEKELDSLKDLMQRRQADFENYKKRAMKQQEDFKKFAIKNLAVDVITINDDMLRALEAADQVVEGATVEDTHKSFVDGISMLSKQLEGALGKYGIEEIEAHNVDFDPNFHEAMEIEMQEGIDTDTVTWVYQKGFKLEDQVLRSAKVRVAKPAPVVQKDVESEEAKTSAGE